MRRFAAASASSSSCKRCICEYRSNKVQDDNQTSREKRQARRKKMPGSHRQTNFDLVNKKAEPDSRRFFHH